MLKLFNSTLKRNNQSETIIDYYEIWIFNLYSTRQKNKFDILLKYGII